MRPGREPAEGLGLLWKPLKILGEGHAGVCGYSSNSTPSNADVLKTLGSLQMVW